jgi:CheY-like chemotaxis protein
VVDRQTRHLARLVDELLDITRVRSGKISLQRVPVELGRLVHGVVADHRELLRGRTVVTRVPDAPVWTSGDPTRLAQVLTNLLTNAAKFTPSGGDISVTLALADGNAVLEVTDTGVGIDSESLGRLFVPFVQADRSLDRTRHGLGLGLALLKTLVELHGGRVDAHSLGPGTGARFTVTLPLVAVEPPLPRGNAVLAPTPRNVLLVEDDADVAEWLATVLSLAGHRVTIAGDGASGVDKARELGPDVILCDIGLPGALDGYAVARTLQQDAGLDRIYRVALSGFTQPDDQARARAAGFDIHFGKPPDLDALKRLLSELPRRQ